MEYALFSYFAVGARLLHPSDKQRQRPPGTEHLLWFWRKQAPPNVISGYQLPFFAKIKIPPWKNEETNAPRYSLIAYSEQRSIGLLCRSTLLKMRFIIKSIINKQKEKKNTTTKTVRYKYNQG
ncbi:hypothetical protein NGI12_05195 [Raoultella terrigena]|uniref:hypothetical protein n=1 Tax=Raoultella terrigena TaxID=577 RepID=UPI002DBBF794|nr:hypothetical protein [Raoultella terrigena]MEB8192867.1 hypothetical protein [Raoultella terrigena]